MIQVCRLRAADGEAAVVGPGAGEVVHARARPGRRRAATSGMNIRPARSRCGAGADDDDDRHDHLHDGDAEVAAGGVEAERLALLRLGEEERDVRHRRGEVAAAEAGERRAREQDAERRVRAAARPTASADGRDEQQQRGDDRPVAAAEARHRERVGDPQRRADEAGHRDQPELLVQR